MKKIIRWIICKKRNHLGSRHWYMALYYSGIAILSGLLGIIHAFIPPVFGFLPYKLAKKVTDGTEKNFPSCLIDDKEN